MTACGHTYVRRGPKLLPPQGMDLHRPDNFVPVTSLKYLDPALGLTRLKELVLRAWPRIATHRSPLLPFNSVWSAVPSIQKDLLRCAAHKHVVLAEAMVPDLREITSLASVRVTLLTLSSAGPQAIRLQCRQAKGAQARRN